MVKQTIREMLNSIENYCKFGDNTPRLLKQKNLSKLIGEYKNLYYKNRILQSAIIRIIDTSPIDYDILTNKQLNIIIEIIKKEDENRAKKRKFAEINPETSE